MMNNMPNIVNATMPGADVRQPVEQQQDMPLKQRVLECSRMVLQRFRDSIHGRVYDVILAGMEQPLLIAVIEECRGNQTKAAHMLSLSRGTLRKKLKSNGIDKHTNSSALAAMSSVNELQQMLAPMRDCVLHNVRRYLHNMRGQPITKMYAMVLAEIEEPLLTAVMEETRDNQTRTAKMLGLSRGTLRKKLKSFGITRD